jgi:hypothetical protein
MRRGGTGSTTAISRRGQARLRTALLATSALIAAALPAAAQDATWLQNPGSGDFNTAANWSPATVPTGTAFFGTSNTTALSFSADTTIGGWTFNAGASNYTFTNIGTLIFTGAGIVINGGSATEYLPCSSEGPDCSPARPTPSGAPALDYLAVDGKRFCSSFFLV